MALLGLLFLLALVGGIIALLVWLAQRLDPVQREEVEELAQRAGVRVTTSSVGLVVDAVARTRLWRTVGVTVALGLVIVATAYDSATNQRLTINLTVLLWGLVGYWVGCIVGELRTARAPLGDGPRSASLVRRQLGDYVGSWATARPRLLGAIGLVAATCALLLGSRDLWVLLGGYGAAAVAGVLAVVSRYVVERPRPDLSPDVAEADDALRSRSLHAIAGASVGICTWAASLAVAGLLVALLARGGVSAFEGGPDGGVVPIAAAGVLVVVVCGLVIPIAGFVVGRRLMRTPFPVVRAAEALP